MASPHLLFPITLSLLLLLLLSCYAGNFTTLSQCSALLDLKQSFTSYSLKLDTWHPHTNCCHWDGVSCDASSGVVIGLDLSSCLLTGKIGPTLFNLTSLQTLNLAYNQFDQTPTPDGFELLPNLTSLNLSTGGLSGQIPIGISKLTNLVSLDLSWGGFLELKHPDFETLIRNMSNLRELYLDGVTISSGHGHQWSIAVANCTPKLTALSLVDCSITCPIHSSLAGLHNLSLLRLDENDLNCSVPEFFGNLSSLRELSLADCRLTWVFPNNVLLLKNLKVVDLSDNEDLSGSLSDFPDESKLEILRLSNTNISGPLPNSIGKLQYLTLLYLQYCQFTGVLPSSIGNLTQLFYLDLSHTNFSGAIPSSVGKLQHLIAMDLNTCQFSGALPTSIGNLTQLVFMDLSFNHFNGSIPSSVGKLQHLTSLDLSDNLLSGQIPSSLFTLSSLKKLWLNRNQLSGQLQEFSNGSSSQLVDLNENLLQGKMPSSVFQLSALESLALASNNFSGTIELHLFSTLRNLSYLDLSYNSISILDIDLNDSVIYPLFTYLALSSCNLTKVPSFLRYQNQVETLDLSNNRIEGAIPNWIWTLGNSNSSASRYYLNLSCNLLTSVDVFLPNLSFSPGFALDLHSNLISGPIFLPPTSFKILDYSNNKFSSSIPSNFTSFYSEPYFLSLANNSIIGEIPPSICNSSYLPSFDFSNNKLSGLIPPCLIDGTTGLHSLKVLNLRGNQLRGTIPQSISQNCSLRALNLNDNYLEGRLPQSLANCNLLVSLDLGNNHINDHFPFWLGKIPSLRILVLGSNELYGPVELPPEINTTNYFPVLQIFDVSSNHFNGSLPVELYKKFKAMMVKSALYRNSTDVQSYAYSSFGFDEEFVVDNRYYQISTTVISKGLIMELVNTLRMFTSIDFSNNGFEGNIPEIIGELKSLNMLNFTHNALTGSIPPSIGNLLQLESLDLSGNKLSGNIPQELSHLTFLEFLNLSNNNLVGEITQGNQLSTFSNTSFGGNKGLCGVPLTKHCSNATPPDTPGGKLLPLKSNHSPSTYVIGLALFIGLGFGVGMAIVLVLQNVPWKFLKKQEAGQS